MARLHGAADSEQVENWFNFDQRPRTSHRQTYDGRPQTSSSSQLLESSRLHASNTWRRPCTATAALARDEKNSISKLSSSTQVNQPQRVPIPKSLKVPIREIQASRDQKIRAVLDSRNGSRQPRTREGKNVSSSDAPPKGKSIKPKLNTSKITRNNNSIHKKLNDLNMLAVTCERAGLRAQQGKVYLSIAILLDNLGHWQRAIKNYKRYLTLCTELQDKTGEHIALNCIGINYYLLATNEQCETQNTVGIGNVNVNRDAVNAAISFHKRHESEAKGVGKFIALTNLGLCYSCLGSYDEAARCHQESLRNAITAQNTHAQCTAIGNLAVVGKLQGDLASAKICLDKHLRLTRDLGNWTAESLACHQLGSIANKRGNYQEANKYFEEARSLARSNKEKGMLKLVNCEIGVTNGNLRLAQYIKNLTVGIRPSTSQA